MCVSVCRGVSSHNLHFKSKEPQTQRVGLLFKITYLIMCSQIFNSGLGEMTQRLIALVALPDLSSFPTTSWRFAIAYNEIRCVHQLQSDVHAGIPTGRILYILHSHTMYTHIMPTVDIHI